jgi:hypothetical protein
MNSKIGSNCLEILIDAIHPQIEGQAQCRQHFAVNVQGDPLLTGALPYWPNDVTIGLHGRRRGLNLDVSGENCAKRALQFICELRGFIA